MARVSAGVSEVGPTVYECEHRCVDISPTPTVVHFAFEGVDVSFNTPAQTAPAACGNRSGARPNQ